MQGFVFWNTVYKLNDIDAERRVLRPEFVRQTLGFFRFLKTSKIKILDFKKKVLLEFVMQFVIQIKVNFIFLS